MVREANIESFTEKLISKDKYLWIFLRQREVIIFIILQIFFETRAVLRIWEYHSGIPQLLRNIPSRDAFFTYHARKVLVVI